MKCIQLETYWYLKALLYIKCLCLKRLRVSLPSYAQHFKGRPIVSGSAEALFWGLTFRTL